MPTRTVHPDEVVVSEFNERQSFDPERLVDDELVASVKRSGVIQPPLVTENAEGELAAYVGQRRVAAARRAGLDEIPVIVNDVDEQEALIASITENTELFSKAVSPADRAQAVQSLWEMVGGDGTPVFSHIGSMLGVSPDTVRTWYEPMRDEWKGTSIDPTTSSSSDDGRDDDFFSGDHTLGERSLGEVRRMSADKEEAEAAAWTALELEATQEDLSEAKQLVESEGLPATKAIEDIVGGAEETQMQVEITFSGDLRDEVTDIAETTGMSEETIIREAVEYYLDEHDPRQKQAPTTETKAVSDLL